MYWNIYCTVQLVWPWLGVHWELFIRKYWYSAVVKHSIRAAEHHKYYPSYKQTYYYYQTTVPHLIQILMEDSFTADPTGKFLPDVCLKIKKTMKIKILSSINFVSLIADLLYCEKHVQKKCTFSINSSMHRNLPLQIARGVRKHLTTRCHL